MSGADSGTTSRRDFLKVSGAVAIGLVGAAAVSFSVRRVRVTAPPVWSAIPDQIWAVGVPVYIDLSNYCTDADGDTLTYALSHSLPAGVRLAGGVISGTPTSAFPATTFYATADDQGGESVANEPRLVASPNPSHGAVRLVGDTRQGLPAHAVLRVFTVGGRRIYERDFMVTSSPYELDWNGRTTEGERVSSGIYMVNVVIASESAKTRLVMAE